MLFAILQQGITDARLEGLGQAVRVHRRTVERWRRWWRDTFTTTPFWQAARAAFMPTVEHGRLPASLLERFAVMPEACFQDDDDADRLIALLRFLGPITGGRMHAI